MMPTSSSVRIAIVGGRDFPSLRKVQVFIRRLACRDPSAIIITGGARGVDTVAAVEARLYGLVVIEHKPDYDKYPPLVAPLMRNTLIVEDCDRLVAFWDGESRGTKDSVDKALERGVPVVIIGP